MHDTPDELTDARGDGDAVERLRQRLPRTWRPALAAAPDRERRLRVAPWTLIVAAALVLLYGAVKIPRMEAIVSNTHQTMGSAIALFAVAAGVALALTFVALLLAGTLRIRRAARDASTSLTLQAQGLRFEDGGRSRVIAWRDLVVHLPKEPLAPLVLRGGDARFVLRGVWLPDEGRGQAAPAFQAQPERFWLEWLPYLVDPLTPLTKAAFVPRALLTAELAALSGREPKPVGRHRRLARLGLQLLLVVPVAIVVPPLLAQVVLPGHDAGTDGPALDRALRVAPWIGALHAEKASLLARDGRLEEALREAEAAFERDPHVPPHGDLRASLLDALGTSRESVLARVAAWPDKARDVPGHRLALAHRLVVLGETDKARRQARLAARTGDDAEAQDVLAVIHVAEGNPAAALELLPDDPQRGGRTQPARVLRAIALRCAGDGEASQRELDAALARRRGDPEALFVQSGGTKPWPRVDDEWEHHVRRRLIEVLMERCSPPVPVTPPGAIRP